MCLAKIRSVRKRDPTFDLHSNLEGLSIGKCYSVTSDRLEGESAVDTFTVVDFVPVKSSKM